MKKYGLIGKNISYSYSPLIHGYLLNYYNINGTYDLLDIDKLHDISKEEILQYHGLNVTIPYKKDIIDFCNITSKNINQIGAINTLSIDDDIIAGYNTDIEGFNKFFKDKIQQKFSIYTVAILGNSATGRMLKYYFNTTYPKIEIRIFSSESFKVKGIFTYGEFENFKCDFIINTTPLGQGLYKGQSILDNIEIQRKNIQCVLDFNYNPYKSKFLIDFQKCGIKVYNGLEILVNQAVFSFERWNKLTVKEQLYTQILHKINFKATKGIVIYGMPLSGKTYLFNELKERSKLNKKLEQYAFYDLDKEVYKSIKKNTKYTTLEQYINDKTIEKFREKEFEILQNIIQTATTQKYNIIFLGGGCLTNDEIFQLLENYQMFYLEESLQKLFSRLNDKEIKSRPLLNVFTPKEILEKLYKQREKLYKESADYILQNKDEFIYMLEEKYENNDN